MRAGRHTSAEMRRAGTGVVSWITLDIFFKDEPAYRFVTSSAIVSPQVIGRLYRVDPATVKYFELPGILAVKISFPRPVSAGSFADRDLHAGQQHVPLAGLRLPTGTFAAGSGSS